MRRGQDHHATGAISASHAAFETPQTIFLPVIGLVDETKLKPGDLLGLNKDSYLVLDNLPAECAPYAHAFPPTLSRYDSRVKAMEVDERPTEEYGDIGGLDKQIAEVVSLVYYCTTQRGAARRGGRAAHVAPGAVRQPRHQTAQGYQHHTRPSQLVEAWQAC